MGFGIAFAGGGAKGAAHVGVLKALEENGLIPTSVAGTSAGSVIAGLYSIGFSVIEMEKLINKLSKTGLHLLDPDYKGILKTITQFATFKPITLTGLIKGDKLEELICDLTNGKNMRDAKMRIVIPCVDLNSGSTIVYTNSLSNVKSFRNIKWSDDAPLCQAIRASCAIPAVFKPKNMENMCLVDGGVTDVLPVDLLLSTGENNVLAIDISNSYMTPKKNNIIEVATHSLSIMQNRLFQYISSGEKLLLKPKLPSDASTLNFLAMNDCMEAGYNAAMEAMPTIKALFS
ncbi:patatin-like phospholipase family protein [Paludicola sp. MB14-C6]|uniref:patatin-like phospholipase family protein n=1 Tax=Paludihabitans sp. MB14-C6 TaxID=3070656 RepID=UPI0027DCBCCE|nr:patatin-like phospholipase family protein [Paludicola sp. MB14-C6]WMJ23649.1 patatin-like phospholipase family protein [Paludicola sp. MB14-C6]